MSQGSATGAFDVDKGFAANDAGTATGFFNTAGSGSFGSTGSLAFP
jgi:hypothetical protein